MFDDHWVSWHAAYDDPNSSLSRRLAAVQRRLRDALDAAPPGEIRLISICAGEGRDVLGVLADHPRRDDVDARLIELDAALCATARSQVLELGLTHVAVHCGDASVTSAYVGAVPADVVLACGIFGNVSDDDIHGMVGALPSLMAPHATVIWTRHTLVPDLTPAIRSWFAGAGFDEVGFDTEPGRSYGVGTHRLVGEPARFDPGVTMFTFVGDGAGAHR